jgi:hypothetical protein
MSDAPSPQRLIEEAAQALDLGHLLPTWRSRGKVPRARRGQIAAKIGELRPGTELRDEDYGRLRPIYGRLPDA